MDGNEDQASPTEMKLTCVMLCLLWAAVPADGYRGLDGPWKPFIGNQTTSEPEKKKGPGRSKLLALQAVFPSYTMASSPFAP